MEIRLFFKKDPIFHLLKLPKLIIFKKKFENPFSSGKILISSSKKEILGFRIRSKKENLVILVIRGKATHDQAVLAGRRPDARNRSKRVVRLTCTSVSHVHVYQCVRNRPSIRLYERAAPPAVSLPSSRRTFVSYKTPGKLTSGHLPRPLYPPRCVVRIHVLVPPRNAESSNYSGKFIREFVKWIVLNGQVFLVLIENGGGGREKRRKIGV